MNQEPPPYQVVVDRIKNAPLKAMFLAHFVLTTWGVQGYWSPDSYIFYNLIFFFTIFWTLHSKDSEEPILLAFSINCIAIILDVIVISLYFPNSRGSSERFSKAMAIMNLVLRPLSCLVLHKTWKDRQAPALLREGGGPGSHSYQDIATPKQSYPGSEGHSSYQ